jgi:hypothetical protein
MGDIAIQYDSWSLYIYNPHYVAQVTHIWYL